VMVDPRSNALIVRAANPVRLAYMRSVIEKLDQPTQRGGPTGNIWVVYLKNADATKLATVLRAAFAGAGGGAGGTTTGTTPTGQTRTSTAQQGNVTTLGSTQAGGTASAQATAPVAASPEPSTGGFIQADPSTNSLVITAPEPLYRQIRATIDQLDARRAQVFVESMIVKMDANKAAEFGFQWQNIWGKRGDTTIPGAGTNFRSGTDNILDLSAAAARGRDGAADLLAAGGVASGLNIGVLKKIGDFYTLGALAHFLETNGGANVLSTPNLVALDNEEAKIVIGQNVPFVTGTFTNTGTGTGAINPFQTIERQDVGLTLRIKSQIGEGGTIRMTIFQENSSVTAISPTTGPTTDKSSIETTVVVDDGQVMVLGGLLKDEYTDNEDRVPGLGSIPVVGNLFRSESRTRIKTNLMVFLRPVVVRDQPRADALTLDRYEAIRSLQQGAQPKPSILVPVNEAPVLPPLAAPAPAQPASVPTPLGNTPPIERRP
jgi:general secretion pathway protein D